MTSSGDYTVSGSALGALVQHARTLGISLEPALARVGLSGVDLFDPGLRVVVSAQDVVWDEAARLSGDVAFGLRFGQRADLDAFHVVGHLAETSADVGQALDRVVAFSRLLHDAGRTEIERDEHGARFYPGCRGLPAPPPRHVAEYTVASVLALLRRLTGRAVTPVAVHFEHPAPENTAAHLSILGVRPTFGAPETYLALDPPALRLPVLSRGKAAIGRYLEEYAAGLLAELGPGGADVVELTRRAILADLHGGACDLEHAARRMGLSARTLQRRLRESGTGFSELLDEAREGAARRYLADGRLGTAEIGYLLGFADPSNFHRAFRRWTGTTPGEYAKASRAAAATGQAR